MKKLKVGVLGAGGRMGQEVAKALAASKDLEAYFGCDGHGVSIGFEHASKALDAPAAKKIAVWIDFSSPEALDRLLDAAVKSKTPVVSGTTGISEKMKKKIEKASRSIPILWASNMSLGVAVLNEALNVFAKLKDFDFQIEEIHHNRKKDKPSGTALTLQENLEKVVKRKLPEPLAMRGGGVFGVHKVWAFSDEEVLMFEHNALNRAVFAKGAVHAARWLARKKPGLYSIRDLL